MYVRSVKILFILLLVLLFQLSFAGEPKNYCKDPESWDEWNALVEKYPNDKDVQMLHALRIGLCAKIDQGSITFDMANELFNRAHDIVINRKQAEREQQKKEL